MSFIARPAPLVDFAPKNELGLTLRDYEGGMSTVRGLWSRLGQRSDRTSLF